MPKTIVDFTTREYQMVKTKSYLKNNKLCFLFQNSTEKAFNWLTKEQTLDRLNLNYYKVNTLSAYKVFNISKHRLKSLLITGTTTFLKQKLPCSNFIKFNFERVADMFVLIAVKVNNVVVSIEQFKNLFIFYYQLIVVVLYNCFIASIKSLTNKKYFRNSVS